MTLLLETIPGSFKSAHQSVMRGRVECGRVWRELREVTVSKPTQRRRTAMKWRWFAKATNSTAALGEGTHAALVAGLGYTSRKKALDALDETLATAHQAA